MLLLGAIIGTMLGVILGNIILNTYHTRRLNRQLEEQQEWMENWAREEASQFTATELSALGLAPAADVETLDLDAEAEADRQLDLLTKPGAWSQLQAAEREGRSQYSSPVYTERDGW